VAIKTVKQEDRHDLRRRLQEAADEAESVIRPAGLANSISLVFHRLRNLRATRRAPVDRGKAER
jgi:hypothetical protein